jgi:hypothetical protein
MPLWIRAISALPLRWLLLILWIGVPVGLGFLLFRSVL